MWEKTATDWYIVLLRKMCSQREIRETLFSHYGIYLLPVQTFISPSHDRYQTYMRFSVQLRLFSAAVECGGLPDPLNGYVVLTDVILGSVATYNCQTGFSLVGSATRECARSGRWTGVPPTCESKNISAPHPSITCSNFYILLLAKLIGEESQNRCV